MGADMALVFVEYPDDFDQVRRRIDGLSDQRLREIGDLAWGFEAETEDLDGIRQELHEALDFNRRDVAVITIDGRDYAFTGGMSGGDWPTEAYQGIVALYESGVCERRDPIGRRRS